MQTSSSMPRIAAVVVTYNRCALLEQCLNALLRQDRVPDEILVIDNASTDGTRDMLQQKYDGKITHVQLKENLGASGGFYEGTRRAYEKGHDWIWVMDDDVEPAMDALNALVKSPAFEDASVGLLASLVSDPQLKVQKWLYTRFNVVMDSRLAIGRDSLKQTLVPIEAAGFLGAMVRREAISSVGLPRKDLFIYWDDTEFIYRVSRRFKVFLIPSSKIIHKNVWVPPRRKFLGLVKMGAGVPITQVWRSYYGVRNGIFMRTRYVNPWLAPLIPAMVLTKSLGAAILLHDHKFARCKLLCQAAIDGVLGRLGKRISP